MPFPKACGPHCVNPSALKGQSIAIWGYGREGRAALQYLRTRLPGQPLTVFCNASEADEIAALGDAGILCGKGNLTTGDVFQRGPKRLDRVARRHVRDPLHERTDFALADVRGERCRIATHRFRGEDRLMQRVEVNQRDLRLLGHGRINVAGEAQIHQQQRVPRRGTRLAPAG